MQSPQNAELVESAGVLNAIDALYTFAGEGAGASSGDSPKTRLLTC